MNRLKHYDHLGTARFITFSCFKRLPLLTDSRIIKILLHELESARQKYEFRIFAYVVMPNHVHIVINPTQEMKMGKVIGSIKGQSAYKILGVWKRSGNGILNKLQVIRRGNTRYALWLEKCYDHNCRTIDVIKEKVNYCHLNPVKAGLVPTPELWPWSSYQWYHTGVGNNVQIDSWES